jgi:hypothetical protein
MVCGWQKFAKGRELKFVYFFDFLTKKLTGVNYSRNPSSPETDHSRKLSLSPMYKTNVTRFVTM